jgi:hypothetical protein
MTGCPVLLSQPMARAAAAVVRDLLRADDRLAGELRALAAHRTTDRPPGHGILVDDISEISLTGQLAHGVGHQVRARIRAFHGDLVVSNAVPPAGFDDYTRLLGLGSVQWIHPGTGPRVCADALRSADSLGRLVEFASTRTAYVSPYMASDGAWDLVRELSQATGRAVPMVARGWRAVHEGIIAVAGGPRRDHCGRSDWWQRGLWAGCGRIGGRREVRLKRTQSLGQAPG